MYLLVYVPILHFVTSTDLDLIKDYNENRKREEMKWEYVVKNGHAVSTYVQKSCLGFLTIGLAENVVDGLVNYS